MESQTRQSRKRATLFGTRQTSAFLPENRVAPDGSKWVAIGFGHGEVLQEAGVFELIPEKGSEVLERLAPLEKRVAALEQKQPAKFS